MIWGSARCYTVSSNRMLEQGNDERRAAKHTERCAEPEPAQGQFHGDVNTGTQQDVSGERGVGIGGNSNAPVTTGDQNTVANQNVTVGGNVMNVWQVTMSSGSTYIEGNQKTPNDSPTVELEWLRRQLENAEANSSGHTRFRLHPGLYTLCAVYTYSVPEEIVKNMGRKSRGGIKVIRTGNFLFETLRSNNITVSAIPRQSLSLLCHYDYHEPPWYKIVLLERSTQRITLEVDNKTT